MGGHLTRHWVVLPLVFLVVSGCVRDVDVGQAPALGATPDAPGGTILRQLLVPPETFSTRPSPTGDRTVLGLAFVREPSGGAGYAAMAVLLETANATAVVGCTKAPTALHEEGGMTFRVPPGQPARLTLVQGTDDGTPHGYRVTIGEKDVGEFELGESIVGPMALVSIGESPPPKAYHANFTAGPSGGQPLQGSAIGVNAEHRFAGTGLTLATVSTSGNAPVTWRFSVAGVTAHEDSGVSPGSLTRSAAVRSLGTTEASFSLESPIPTGLPIQFDAVTFPVDVGSRPLDFTYQLFRC